MKFNMTHPHMFIAARPALDFILAGKSTFTLVSLRTSTRYTFKVEKPKKHLPHFVRLLSGPDNVRSYVYIGTIFDGRTFRTSKASRLDRSAAPIKAIMWTLERLIAGAMPTTLEVWHEGRCGKCNRLLTVPSSIELGIGPTCASM